MSIKDINKIINLQDGTTGNIIKCIDYDSYCSNSYYDSACTVSLTYGEYILYNEIRRLLLDSEHDINIKLGYKN